MKISAVSFSLFVTMLFVACHPKKKTEKVYPSAFATLSYSRPETDGCGFELVIDSITYLASANSNIDSSFYKASSPVAVLIRYELTGSKVRCGFGSLLYDEIDVVSVARR